LSALAGKQALSLLKYATLVFPPGFGRLDDGIFHPALGNEPVSDVAETTTDSKERQRARFLASPASESQWEIRPLTGGESFLAEDPEKALNDRNYRLVLVQEIERLSESGEPETMLLFYAYARKQGKSMENVGLDRHQTDVQREASRMATALGLSSEEFEWAATHHDDGKQERIWQTAMAGLTPDEFEAGQFLAKSKRKARSRQLGGYRHEFVSVLRGEGSAPTPLSLQLIASHHGWARPHFRANAAGPAAARLPYSGGERNACIRRFAELQRQYGPWGLAWMESILRCADWIASGLTEQIDN
jgi:CRISPR-associated endonuclease/helicase Cas3